MLLKNLQLGDIIYHRKYQCYDIVTHIKNNENDFVLYFLYDSDILFNKFNNSDDLSCLSKLDDGLFKF